MSVRDRIANLNSSKTPIITTVGSNEPQINRLHSSSSTTSSGESATVVVGEAAVDETPKKSTIAERIAKLKAGQADIPGTRMESPSVSAENVTKGKLSSRIAMLGANINIASLGPSKSSTSASFSPASSHVSSNSTSRESTLEHCQLSSDLHDTHDSVNAKMVHVSLYSDYFRKLLLSQMHPIIRISYFPLAADVGEAL